MNLFVNAAEAMKSQGALRIKAETTETPGGCHLAPKPSLEYIKLSITDSGGGIAPEHIGRMFEPFFTTKNAGANRGTGLGLSLVYTLAEKEGIGLAVRSALGEGATFILYIPVEAAVADGTAHADRALKSQ